MSKKHRRLNDDQADLLGLPPKEPTKYGNAQYYISDEEYESVKHLASKPIPREPKNIDLISYTETSEEGYHEEMKNTDTFKRYCEEEGLDIKRVKSAKYVNHQDQQKFNVVLNYDEDNIISLEELEKRICETIRKDVKPYKYKSFVKENEKALHAYISDAHVGAETLSDSIYENEYNENIFRTRMEKTFQMCLKKKQDYGIFDTLFIANLGDALDGFDGYTTRGGHKLPQNMDNKQAFDCYVTEYKRLLESVHDSQIAENIVIHFVTDDNHSGDYGWMAARAIQEYCISRFPNINIIIQNKFIDVYSYGIHNFLLTHGKDKREMKAGMPKLLDQKTELKLKDFIDYHNIKGEIHVVKGDLHQDSVDFCNKFRYRNVLSLYGASKWIHLNFGWSRCGISYEVVDKLTPDVQEGRVFM